MHQQSHSGSCGIAIMAKASKAGRTKTRLAPLLGAERAAELNTAFLKDGADNLIAAAALAPIVGYMAFGPPGEGDFFAFLPAEVALLPAWAADFGSTLVCALEGVFDQGHGSACLVNADSPTLPPSLLAEAAEALAAPGDRVVLGPSLDGGYYLIGLKHVHAPLFDGVAWSTASVFQETLARARTLALPVHQLAPWYDVDDGESLATLRRELIDRLPFDPARPSAPALHSRALLDALG